MSDTKTISAIEDVLTPERLAFMAKHGGMALPTIEVETSIGIVTLSIIARPKAPPKRRKT